MAILQLAGCGAALTDVAMRFRRDAESHAQQLLAGNAPTLHFDYKPNSFPQGCSGDYELRIKPADLRYTAISNTIYVGCVGDPTFNARGYNYSTTLDAGFLPAANELAIRHASGVSVQVTLEHVKTGVRIQSIE